LIGAISRLAWPVAVIALAIVFRKTIAEQLGRLKTIKTAGAEMNFAERVDEAVRESGKLTEALVGQVADERQANLARIASADPPRAIKGAWEMVREAAQDVARRRGLDWATTKDLVERISSEGELDSAVVRLVLDLRNLRYEMTDQEKQNVAPATATAYVAAAGNVADVLRAIPDMPTRTTRG
jgi:hypothetical protein